MTPVNLPLTIVQTSINSDNPIIFRSIPFAVLTVGIVAEELEKNGILKCERGTDDLDDFTAVLGTADGVAFDIHRYDRQPESEPTFALTIDRTSLEDPKFDALIFAYRLLEQLGIPWSKVNWVSEFLKPDFDNSVKSTK